MRFSEFKEDKGSNLASRVIRNYARELGADSMDYGMFIKSADLLDKDMLKSLALHIEKSDTAPREYVMKKIADHNPEIFKKMYGDQEGYLSLMKPQKDLTDGEDNTDRGMNKYGLAARHKDGKFHSYRHGKHTGSFDSPGELAKHQQDLIKDESVTNEDQTTIDVKAILDRHGVKSTYDIEYGGEAYGDLFDYFSSDPDEMPYGIQKARTGMPDEWIADRLIDLGLLKEAFIKEDAPFGSGMELLRMAIMRKFITVQEWDLLKHKWKEAAAEVEEKYSDWPEDEGFGSSDHNFAIRDLMTAVGYEFDDQDTSGRFVVTKQPEEIEKAGIKNARMKGQPVAQESEPSADAERADAARGMWASSKEIQSRFKTWQDFMNSEDFDEWLDDKFRDEMGEDAGDDWSKLTNALIKKYGEEKAKVITDYAQIRTDSAEELMKSHGLTFKGDMKDDERWFQKYPWLKQLANKSWMARLFDIAGQGPDYGTPKTEDGTDNRDDLEKAYMLAVRHHEGPGDDEGQGDGNYAEDVGDLLMDYYEKTGQKPDHEQIERISNKMSDNTKDVADILQAEGIDGKIWLELAKKYYGELGMKINEPITYPESVEEDEGEKFTFGQIAKAKAYAKTYANDMTSAVKNIEAIAIGLSKHPEVADTLKRANENQELNRITKLAGLGEGASMLPYYKDPRDEKQMTWTFPDGWQNDEPLDTPYMSNASMRQFLDTLGYNPDFEDNQPPVPAKEFIARTTQWLQKNIDKPSQEIPTTVDRSGGGATMIGGGKPEGWDNRQVKHHNELARKIIAKYPEVTHFGFN